MYGANVSTPGERWADLPSPAKVVRLAFHDCMPYADGSGGCDGCLEWTDITKRYDRNLISPRDKFKITVEELPSHNAGLDPTVEVLERIYTVDANFPGNADTLPTSLRDLGVSRADFWAFAAMVAIEFAVDTNNQGTHHTFLRTSGISLASGA